MIAKITVLMIGIPAGAIGVSANATTRAERAIAHAFLLLSRFQTNPKKIAGIAVSSPQAAGSPSALAPRAPNRVNRFQKI